MKPKLALFLLAFGVSSAAAEDATYRGKLDASGTCFRNMTYVDFEAKIEGLKVAGNWNNPVFTSPTSKSILRRSM